MRIRQQEYEHPTQVSHVRLNLYRYVPPEQELVSGMLPTQAGFHVTEERVGSVAVVATLGFFADEAEARDRFTRRAEELARQGWGLATSALQAPSIPPVALVGSEPEGASAALAVRGEPERVQVPGDGTPRPVKPA